MVSGISGTLDAMKRISVFCGANKGSDPEFSVAASRLGRELVRRDIELVFGGGKVGLMGMARNKRETRNAKRDLAAGRNAARVI
jgi:hypothetical protein